MGIVACNQEVARFADEAIAEPLRRVLRLQIARGGKFRQRIACAPEGFGGLLGAQLAAMPDHRGASAAPGGIGRHALDGFASASRQRTLRVDSRPDSVAVMNEEQFHSGCVYFISPAAIRTLRRFSGSGSGHVVNGLNAHGGL